MSKPVAFIVVKNGQTWLRTTAETEEAIRTGFITETIPLYKQREPLCRHLIDQAYMASNFDNYYDCFDDGIKFAEKVHGIGADDE